MRERIEPQKNDDNALTGTLMLLAIWSCVVNLTARDEFLPQPDKGPRILGIGDFNNDGRDDLLMALEDGTRLVWCEQDPRSSNHWVPHDIEGPFEVIFSALPADMDGDGDTDIVGIIQHQGDVVWWENLNELGTFWQPHIIREGLHYDQGLVSLFVADVDEDGTLEVLSEAEEGGVTSLFVKGQGDEGAWYERPRPEGLESLPNLQQITRTKIDFESLPGCIIPNLSLVSWWPLDETSGPFANDIKSNNGGTFEGPVPTSGKVAGAYYFEGGDQIRVFNSLDLNAGVLDFTITAWIKTNDPLGILFSKYSVVTGSSTDGYEILLVNGRIRVTMTVGANRSFYYSNASTRVDDDQWHFIAVSVDRDNPSGLKVFIDGELDATYNPRSVQGNQYNTRPFRIGGSYQGKLDEVSFYRGALPAAQIQREFSAGTSGKCFCPPLNVGLACLIESSSIQSCFAFASGGNPPYSFGWSYIGQGTMTANGTVATIQYGQGCDIDGGAISVSVNANCTVVHRSQMLDCPDSHCTGFDCFP